MELSYIHYILTGYFAARVLIGFRRWSLVVDALFIGFISAYMWRDAPLLLLALPFFLGVVAWEPAYSAATPDLPQRFPYTEFI